MINYQTVILASWILFLLVWSIGAFNVKRDVRGGAMVFMRSWLLRFFAVLFTIFVALRLATGTAHFTNRNVWFSHDFFVPSPILGWAAATLTLLGVLFAVWARIHLGRNWSPAPVMKEHHELVTSGPYRWVRHPIYTGILVATIGVTLAGNRFGLFTFLAASVIFIIRIKREEKIMLELFAADYPAYQKRTKKLIPFIW